MSAHRPSTNAPLDHGTPADLRPPLSTYSATKSPLLTSTARRLQALLSSKLPLPAATSPLPPARGSISTLPPAPPWPQDTPTPPLEWTLGPPTPGSRQALFLPRRPRSRPAHGEVFLYTFLCVPPPAAAIAPIPPHVLRQLARLDPTAVTKAALRDITRALATPSPDPHRPSDAPSSVVSPPPVSPTSARTSDATSATSPPAAATPRRSDATSVVTPPPSDPPSASTALRHAIPLLKPGSRGEVRWSFPAGEPKTWHFTVTRVHTDNVSVVYAESPGVSYKLPPADPEVAIHAFAVYPPEARNRTITGHSAVTTCPLGAPILPPLSPHPAQGPTPQPDPSTFDYILFCDGGAAPNPGVGGAGLLAWCRATGQYEEYWDHLPNTTNNIMEIRSLAAAVSLAVSHPNARCLIIGDSAFAQDCLFGTSKNQKGEITAFTPKNPAITPHIAPLRAAWEQTLDRTTVCHMARRLGNPADPLCGVARRTAASHDPLGLFPPALAPLAPPAPQPRKRHHTAPSNTDPAPPPMEHHAPPATFDEFIRHNSLRPARRTLPPQVWSLWAQHVRSITRTAAAAPDPTAFSDAFLALMVLPSRLLPARLRKDALKKTLVTGKPPHTQTQPTRDTRTDHEKQAARVERLAGENLLGKAVRALAPGKVADPNDPVVVDILNAKHPPAETPLPDVPTLPPSFPVDPATVETIIQRLGNGTASGLSGWTKELLRAATTADRGVLADIAIIAARVLDGHLLPLARDCLTACKLVPLIKPDPNKLDLRPIAVGDLWDKVIGSIAMETSVLDVHKWQHGVGTRKGTAVAYETVLRWSREGRTFVTIDQKNAFNSLERAAILAQLIKRIDTHAPLVKYFGIRYATPSLLIVSSPNGIRILKVDRGVAQGNVSASYYYCLGSDPVIDEEIAEKIAYMDDATISPDTPEEALDILANLVPKLAAIGLELNLTKCEVVTPSPSPAIVERARIMGVKLIDSNANGPAIKILGAPVGTAQAMTAWCTEKLDKTKDLCNTIVDIALDPRLSYTILKHVHLAKALYLSQMVEPHIVTDALTVFDTITSTTFKRIFGSDISDEAIAHPHAGGLLRLAPLAKYHFDKAHDRHQVGDATHHALLHLPPTDSALEHAQLLSQAGHLADAWMQYSAGQHFPPHLYREAMRIRCLARRSDLPAYCTCGAKLESAHHLLSCPDNHGYTATHRHNEVIASVASIARSHGIIATVEPTCYPAEDARRPDITFSLASKPVAIDFTVVDPCCTSNLRTATLQQGETARHAAERKTAKHGDAVKAVGHNFIPVAAEVYGHIDPQALTMIRAVARELPEHERRHFSNSTIQAIARGIQVGNANIVAFAVRRLHARKGLIQ